MDSNTKRLGREYEQAGKKVDPSVMRTYACRRKGTVFVPFEAWPEAEHEGVVK
jgi:hypothetical protein